MLNFLKKIQYGARVYLAKGGGQSETVDIAGRPTVIMSGGTGEPFIYLHSTLGESFMWLPFFQAFAKKYRVLVPTHPGFGKSGGFDQIDTIEDMAFHYIELLDTLGLEEVILGGVSLGGWIAAEVAVRWPERVKKLWIADAPGLWVEDQPLGDLFRLMQSRDRLREMLFDDPKGVMAAMIIKDDPDEQTMLGAYQAMTVLARLLWERPTIRSLPPGCAAWFVRRCCCGASTTGSCRRPTVRRTSSTSPAPNCSSSRAAGTCRCSRRRRNSWMQCCGFASRLHSCLRLGDRQVKAYPRLRVGLVSVTSPTRKRG